MIRKTLTAVAALLALAACTPPRTVATAAPVVPVKFAAIYCESVMHNPAVAECVTEGATAEVRLAADPDGTPAQSAIPMTAQHATAAQSGLTVSLVYPTAAPVSYRDGRIVR